MSAPQFSIVIPWHGNYAHLVRAVASARAQTLADFEIIVVCNGPAFARLSEMHANPAYADCRFVGIPQGDASRARNAGADAALGEFVAYLDVDDSFAPTKLAAMAAVIAEGESDVLISRGMRVRSGGEKSLYPPQLLEKGEDLGHFFFTRGANCSATAIVARRDFARSIRFIDDLKKFEDNDFLIRCRAAGARVTMLAAPLYDWDDASEAGRLSRGSDYDGYALWAANLRPALSEAGYHAFLARRVAQHQFPRRLFSAGARLYRGWRLGGIPLSETLQFAIRGVLPASLVRRLIDLKTRRDGKRITA